MNGIMSYQCQPCGRVFHSEETLNDHQKKCDGTGREKRVQENLKRYHKGQPLKFSDDVKT